ncbi:MAG: hypothetical protein LEGION0398_MBIBDBAK_00472 [Legionellaceae bacterium]
MNRFLEETKRRKFFYRNIYRGTLTSIVIMFAIIILLVLLNLFYYFNQGDTAYYATSTNGEIFPINATETPPQNANFNSITEY